MVDTLIEMIRKVAMRDSRKNLFRTWKCFLIISVCATTIGSYQSHWSNNFSIRDSFSRLIFQIKLYPGWDTKNSWFSKPQKAKHCSGDKNLVEIYPYIRPIIVSSQFNVGKKDNFEKTASLRMALNDVLDWTIPKFRVKPKNIKQLMLPMIISGWLVGRGVIELPIGKRWPVASCIYSLFTILGYSFIAKVTADDLNIVIPASSSMGIWIIQPIIWMDECVIIGSVLNGWKSTKDVKNIIKGLEACDRRAEKIGILRDYRSVYRRQLFTLIAELVFAISIMLYAFIWIPTNEQILWHTVANTVCIYYPLIVVSIGDAQFITLVRYVHRDSSKLFNSPKQNVTSIHFFI